MHSMDDDPKGISVGIMYFGSSSQELKPNKPTQPSLSTLVRAARHLKLGASSSKGRFHILSFSCWAGLTLVVKLVLFPLVPGSCRGALPCSASTDSHPVQEGASPSLGTTQPGLCLEMIKM